MTFESFSARSCAVDFQTESVLALNKKLKVNWKFQGIRNSIFFKVLSALTSVHYADSSVHQ